MKLTRPAFSEDVIGYCVDENTWQLALTSDRADISNIGDSSVTGVIRWLLTCFLASLSAYIIALGSNLESVVPSALTCAEAWDAIRDVLLLTLTRHYMADDMALALVVSPTLCRALCQLLYNADDSGFRMWLSLDQLL
jgi:hypothetical protein